MPGLLPLEAFSASPDTTACLWENHVCVLRSSSKLPPPLTGTEDTPLPRVQAFSRGEPPPSRHHGMGPGHRPTGGTDARNAQVSFPPTRQPLHVSPGLELPARGIAAADHTPAGPPSHTPAENAWGTFLLFLIRGRDGKCLDSPAAAATSCHVLIMECHTCLSGVYSWPCH